LEQFSAAAYQEAYDLWVREQNQAHVDREIVKGISIDPQGAEEIDDAFWIEKKEDGYDVTISIADVGSQIEHGSQLDIEARKKVEALYENEKCIATIFPKILSSDLFSLNEDKRRPTISAFIKFDKDFVVQSIEFKKTLLINEKQLNYIQADQMSVEDESTYYQILKNSKKISGILYCMRKFGVSAAEASPAPDCRKAIREFMIFFNSKVAQFLKEKNYPAIFRNCSKSEDYRLLPKGKTGLFNVEESPHCDFHEELKTEYLRASSPIREYVCYLNLKILSLILDGNESFSVREVEDLIKATRYPQKKDELTGSLKSSNPANLSEKNFRKLLLEIYKDFESYGALEKEINARLDNTNSFTINENELNKMDDEKFEELLEDFSLPDSEIEGKKKLTSAELYYIIFAKDYGIWKNLKIKALEIVKINEDLLSNFFEHLKSNRKLFGRINFESKNGGKSYTCQVQPVNGIFKKSPLIESFSPSIAQKLAFVAFLETNLDYFSLNEI